MERGGGKRDEVDGGEVKSGNDGRGGEDGKESKRVGYKHEDLQGGIESVLQVQCMKGR
jgi:hypothetical protein